METKLKIDKVELLGEFQKAFEIPEQSKPGFPPFLQMFCRVGLLHEEYSELCLGMAERNRIKIFDALLDMEYLSIGAWRIFGFREELKPIFDTSTTDLHPLQTLKTFYKLQVIEDYMRDIVKAISINNILSVQQAFRWFITSLDFLFNALDLADIRDEGFMRVHKSNMSKLGWDGKPVVTENGKVIKGPNYKGPALDELILKKFGTVYID